MHEDKDVTNLFRNVIIKKGRRGGRRDAVLRQVGDLFDQLGAGPRRSWSGAAHTVTMLSEIRRCYMTVTIPGERSEIIST